MSLSRRSFIRSAALLVCAPAIVRASSLMPVKAWHDAYVAPGSHVEPRHFILPNNPIIGHSFVIHNENQHADLIVEADPHVTLKPGQYSIWHVNGVDRGYLHWKCSQVG